MILKMFGYIKKKKIKEYIKKHEHSATIEERKRKNLEIREIKDDFQKREFEHRNDKRKMKREFLIAMDDDFDALEIARKTSYLEKNYFSLPPNESLKLLTEIAAHSRKIEKRHVNVDKKVKYLRGLKKVS